MVTIVMVDDLLFLEIIKPLNNGWMCSPKSSQFSNTKSEDHLDIYSLGYRRRRFVKIKEYICVVSRSLINLENPRERNGVGFI